MFPAERDRSPASPGRASTTCVAIGTSGGSAAVWTGDLTQSPDAWAPASIPPGSISAATAVACGQPASGETANCDVAVAHPSAPGQLLDGSLTRFLRIQRLRRALRHPVLRRRRLRDPAVCKPVHLRCRRGHRQRSGHHHLRQRSLGTLDRRDACVVPAWCHRDRDPRRDFGRKHRKLDQSSVRRTEHQRQHPRQSLPSTARVRHCRRRLRYRSKWRASSNTVVVGRGLRLGDHSSGSPAAPGGERDGNAGRRSHRHALHPPLRRAPPTPTRCRSRTPAA